MSHSLTEDQNCTCALSLRINMTKCSCLWMAHCLTEDYKDFSYEMMPEMIKMFENGEFG